MMTVIMTYSPSGLPDWCHTTHMFPSRPQWRDFVSRKGAYTVQPNYYY